MMKEFTEVFEEEKEQPMVSYFWKSFTLFLLGILIGLAVAPITKGVNIKSNSGNINDYRVMSNEDEE